MKDATTKEGFRNGIIARAMNSCKHFNGIHNKQCQAGIQYKEDYSMRIPCIPSKTDKRQAWECSLYCVSTREEAEAEADKYERAYNTTIVARSAAKEHAKILGLKRGNGGVGQLKCPCCEDGFINYSVASFNGHMHARCSTKDCVFWME